METEAFLIERLVLPKRERESDHMQGDERFVTSRKKYQLFGEKGRKN